MGKSVIRVVWRRRPIAFAYAAAIAVIAGCSSDTTDTTSAGGSGAAATGPGSSGTGAGAGAGTGTGPSTGGACTVVTTDVAISPGPGTSPAVAFGGDRFAVVWTDPAGGGDIALTLVSSSGEVLSQHAVAAGPAASLLPSVAPDGDGFLVLWQDATAAGSKVFGRHTGPDGTPSGAAFQIASSASMQSRPAAAPLGADGAAVVWMDGARSFVGNVRQTSLLQSTPIADAGYPAVAASTSTIGIAWTTGAKVGFATASTPLGALAPTFFRNAPGTANVPRIAAGDGGSFFVAWEDLRDGDGNERVIFTRVSADGEAGAEIDAPSEAGSANYPDIAWTGENVVIAHYQFRDGPPAIFLSTFGPDLERTADDLQISGDKPARYPRLTWGGSKLAIVYAENNGPVKMALLDCP